jgi:peptidoglycan-N-acetylglucosamine deacetylase
MEVQGLMSKISEFGRIAKQKSQKSLVYLTFDDGPNPDIDEILDILKEKNVQATFFMIEPLINRYPEAVIRLVNEGHYPALHSVTHDKSQLYEGNPLNVAIEMEQTRKTLLRVTGIDSRLTRAPYGSKPYMTDDFRNGLARQEMKMWDWNVDTVDWKYHDTNPQLILENVISGLEEVKGKNEPIVILMHVTKGTALVLPEIIDFIQSEGYQCSAYDPNEHFSMNFWDDSRL